MKKFFSVIILFLISACSVNNTITKIGVSDISDWKAEGKISLIYQECKDECKRKVYQGNITWEHHDNYDNLRVFEPFGTEVMRIISENKRLFIIDENGKKEVSPQELKDYLYSDFPVSELAELITKKRENLEFRKEKWQIQLKNWQENHFSNIRLEDKNVILKLVLNKFY